MTSAGVTTILAALSLLVSGACLAVFFSTDKEAWGRANDATTATFALLLIPAVLEIRSMYQADAAWIGPLSALAVAGLLTIAVTSGLTAAAMLDWKRSAMIGAVGFAALLLWMVGTSMLILDVGELPTFLGWLGLVTAVFVGLTVAVAIVEIVRRGRVMSDSRPPVGMSIGAVLAYGCFVLWTLLLGLSQ